MSEENSLAPVIRLVTAKDSGDNYSSHIVIVDCSIPKIINKAPFFKKGNLKYFFVSNTNDQRNVANCDGIVCRVNDFKNQNNAELKIRYQVSCLPENKDQVALALCKGTRPEHALNNLIELWVRQYTYNREGDFIDNLDEELHHLETDLRQKALVEAGLTLYPVVSLDGKIRPLDLKNFHLTLKLSDYKDKALNLMLNLETKVNDSLRSRAILSKMDESELKERIRKLVKEYSTTITLEQFYYELNTTVQQGLLEELTPLVEKEGRDIETFTLESRDEPPIAKDAQTIIEHSFEEMVGDQFQGKVKITVKMRLKFQSQSMVCYVQANNPKLDVWGKQNIERIFKGLLSLHRYDELADFTSLRESFVSQITSAAQAIGCLTEIISVFHELPELEGQTRFDNEINVSVKLLDYSKQITVRNKVKMILQDQRRYMEKQAPALDSWIQETLKDVFNDVLFKVNYLNFITHFSKEYDTQIRDKMREEAQKIGYKLEQLIITPQLKPLEWLDPFSVEVSDTFTTKLGNKVPLKIVVYMSIDDLGKVQQYLDCDDIKPYIETAIRKVTGSELVKIEPYRFYMCFEVSSENDKSVVQTLKDTIETELVEKFSRDIRSITPMMERDKDEVIQRSENLTSQHADLEFKVTPYVGGETLHFTAQFEVTGVNAIRNAQMAWNTFIQKKFDISTIKKRIEEYLKSKMQAFPPGSLQFNSPEHQQKLEHFMTEQAQDCAINQFGVGITLSAIQRERTSIEENQAALLNSQAQATVQLEHADTQEVLEGIGHDKELRTKEREFDQAQFVAKRERSKQLQEEIGERRMQGLDESEIQPLQDEHDKIQKELQQIDDEKKAKKQRVREKGQVALIGQNNMQSDMALLDGPQSSPKPINQQRTESDDSYEHLTIDQENTDER